MRYIIELIWLNLLLICVIKCDKNEPLTKSSLSKATFVDQNLNSAETKLKESESAGHNKLELKEEKGQQEKFHKENDFKKKEEAHQAKASSDKSAHESLKAGEESSKLKKKQSEDIGHDQGKKSASKTKKMGDHVNIQWDRGHGFVKKWNYDKGSKKKNGYHHEDEGKLNKYNKAYKAENGMLSKGHHAKYKKHNNAMKDSWDSNHWDHNHGAYKHNVKHANNHAHGYHKKAKANEYHDDHWNKGWNDDYHKKDHDSGYDWRF